MLSTRARRVAVQVGPAAPGSFKKRVVQRIEGGCAVQFRLINRAEADRYDAFVRGTPYGHIFQSFAWGEVKKPAWEPLRALLEEDGGRIVAAASILKRRIPFLGRILFYLPRGPVLSDWNDPALFRAFMEPLRELAAGHRAALIKIDPCLREEEKIPARVLREAGFIQARGGHLFGGLQPRYTFRLDIRPDLEQIMERFTKKIRYKIRYGPGKGLRFASPGEAGLDHFLEVMQETGRRAGFPVRRADYYRKVYRVLAERGAANLTIGYYGERPIAAGMTFAFGDKAWAVYGGQANHHRNIYAYHALIWERIAWAKSKGAAWFDFYGVPGVVDEDHPLYGIYYFKKSFGGEYCAFLGEKDLIVSPAHYWVWTRLFPVARRVKNGPDDPVY